VPPSVPPAEPSELTTRLLLHRSSLTFACRTWLGIPHRTLSVFLPGFLTRLQSLLYAAALRDCSPFTDRAFTFELFTLPSHLQEVSNMTTRANSQFPRPDFHRQDKQPYGLRATVREWLQTFHSSRLPAPENGPLIISRRLCISALKIPSPVGHANHPPPDSVKLELQLD